MPVTHAESTITITDEIQSKPYIDMTLDVLKRFGIKTDFTENTIKIKASTDMFRPKTTLLKEIGQTAHSSSVQIK